MEYYCSVLSWYCYLLLERLPLLRGLLAHTKNHVVARPKQVLRLALIGRARHWNGHGSGNGECEDEFTSYLCHALLAARSSSREVSLQSSAIPK